MAKQQGKVKIAMITGYLGAGKTTLLNYVLGNQEGVRAAVIVNDIGEVNIDADLIARSGAVRQMDDVIPLTNGCICCTLADDLAEQLNGIASSGEFDYIVIEASGICEPIPIAYTISGLCEDTESGPALLDLDNIVAVVDSARMYEEFHGGRDLVADDIDEEDIAGLLVQQIEFCTMLVMNKVDLVDDAQMDELLAIVGSLQKDARIVKATRGEVPLDEILNTGRFDFARAYESAAWAEAMAHPEEHEDPEVLEYGISTFVYLRRKPFDLGKFAALVDSWPAGVVRCKGVLWQAAQPDDCFLFEQAGRQFYMTENGQFVAAMSEADRAYVLEQNPSLRDEWDAQLGDRMNKLVFIGQDMDRASIEEALDACLV